MLLTGWLQVSHVSMGLGSMTSCGQSPAPSPACLDLGDPLFTASPFPGFILRFLKVTAKDVFRECAWRIEEILYLFCYSYSLSVCLSSVNIRYGSNYLRLQ